MTDFIPDPFKNYVMKGNAPAPAEKPQEALDLSRLDGMTRDELIALVRLCNADRVAVAVMSPEEIVSAFKLKLAVGGITEKDMFKALPLMREWFDRQLGKAPQSVSMTVESKGIDKLSDERLLRLEKELARMTGEDAVIIPPEPKKLDMVGSDN